MDRERGQFQLNLPVDYTNLLLLPVKMLVISESYCTTVTFTFTFYFVPFCLIGKTNFIVVCSLQQSNRPLFRGLLLKLIANPFEIQPALLCTA